MQASKQNMVIKIVRWYIIMIL